MENLKVKELIEISERIGLILGRAKRKQAILEIMKDARVTTEEVDEAGRISKHAMRRLKSVKFTNAKKLKGEKLANVKLKGENAVRRQRRMSTLS